MKQADIKIILRPGTDGAFACGVMHVLFREGLADRAYMAKYTDCPDELEAHLKTRTPEWASAICGVPVAEIEAFARAVGETKRTFFRLGYGFTRSRNGAAQMHAALCIPAVTGAWQYEGGGAFFNNYALWHFNESIIEGHDAIDQQHARARPVQDRPHPDRRCRGAEGRRADQGDADPEHQSGHGRAGAEAGAPGICARGSVHGGA